ncbi:chemotaxis protein CheW [Massilia pseudoviolaceinigra]|uniref:chemotaxis protein CheW n=1 Tax=Massilia pseudoviolaceinigra TaxID=3057165 RepID=UPI002796C198|nr:chemotaxis protein CheW [Massilia sp. CCM 9206]MDQ1918998.1 chemotaxis protein CheW [Massilia sp. CCM 9206]
MHTISTQSAPIGKMEFLSFQLGGMEYGVDFRKVKELRTFKSLERFASEGAIVKGVAVSRGVIMPLVDMRVAFNERAASPDPMTDVIILQLSTCVMGMVVDGVTDVVRLYPDQITPIPGLTRDSDCDYLMGLGETDGRRLILVDIDKLMSIRRETVAGAQKAA